MNGESKYKAIFARLRDEIVAGRYCPPAAFPSETALVRRFKTGRSTVKRALSELQHQGLLGSHQGRGRFVTRQGTLRKIGILVPDIGLSEYLSRIVHEISRLAQDEHYSVLFGDVDAPQAEARAAQAEALANDFIAQGVSGVIFQPIEFVKGQETITRRILFLFDAARIPVVFCDYDFACGGVRSPYDVVGVSDYHDGELMFRYLRGLGAKRISFVLRPYAPISHWNRFRGTILGEDWSSAKGGANRCRAVVLVPDDVQAVRRWLRRDRPDAVICSNDRTAAMLKRSLEALKVRVPDDLLLAGFDDVSLARLMTPALTTIRLPADQIGRTAFRRLLARIADPNLPPTEILLPTQLIERRSTRR